MVASTAACCLASAAGVAPAWAHVRASSDSAVRGGTAIVTFEVPNESPTGAATTVFTITLPGVASARTATMPGWTATLDRDAASGSVRSVRWTAAPQAGIPAYQFGLFRISTTLPDDRDVVSFPAAQRYADGVVVNWDQPPLPGGGEPEYPAPTLRLSAGPVPPQDGRSPGSGAATDRAAPPADTTARWLAGGALLVGAAGVAISFARRRT
ncbi:YcnI family protein [Mycobacterium sp.]|uniref:YcnI family copper-binding membrane protein n=1 Tax=Mycobacterium sp. TaxID=1785 RepID=UPI0031D083D8